MIERYTPEDLDRFARTIARGPYEHPDQSVFYDTPPEQVPMSKGYPVLEDRLFANTRGFRVEGTQVSIPSYGPWQVDDHANRTGSSQMMDPEVPSIKHLQMPAETAQRLRETGHTIFDQYGRPIHPNYDQLLGDRRIGLPTGIGFFWRYGANKTADAVVHRDNHNDDPELLLIRRKIGRLWALPGGFVNANESAVQAAYREAGEETELWDLRGSARPIRQDLPVGQRTTIHAWCHNTVVLVDADQEYLHDVDPSAASDAIDVGWFDEAARQKLDMFEDHSFYISAAMAGLRSRNSLAT